MQYRYNLTVLPKIHIVGKCRYRAGWHRYNKCYAHMFLFMKKGEFSFELEDHTITLKDDELLFFPGGTRYRVKAKRDCNYRYVHLAPDFPMMEYRDEQMGKNEILLPELISFAGQAEKKEQLLGLIEKLDHLTGSLHPYAHLSGSAALTEFLVFVAACHAQTKSPKPPDAFTCVQDYIHDHIAEKLSLAELSREIGLSSQYIMRLFKKYTGKTVIGYIHSEKMSLVKKMLCDTDFTLEEISEKMGFCGSHYLCRLFKQYYGTTPGEYRSRHRDEII